MAADMARPALASHFSWMYVHVAPHSVVVEVLHNLL